MKKDVLDYEMKSSDGCGVYCGTYRKYNNGSLYGMWLDLTAFSDADEFFEVCRTLHDDEEDPEFMFQDFQGFPKEMYDESMGEDKINEIIEYANLDDNEKEMVDDYSECFGISDGLDLRRIEDRCVGGGYDDLDEFLTQQADEMLDGFEAACKHQYDCKCASDMVDTLRQYFDYEAYCRDNSYYYKIGSNGFVFYDD